MLIKCPREFDLLRGSSCFGTCRGQIERWSVRDWVLMNCVFFVCFPFQVSDGADAGKSCNFRKKWHFLLQRLSWQCFRSRIRRVYQVKVFIKCLNVADCIRLGFVYALQFDSRESKCSWKRLLRRQHLEMGDVIWIHRSTVLGCGMLPDMLRMRRYFKALYVTQLMPCKRFCFLSV